MTLPSLPLILFDASPVLGTSGHRGIGRFIDDLLIALQLTRAEWEGRLRIEALVRFDGGANGKTVVRTSDLNAAADETRALRGKGGDDLARTRRLHLDAEARRAGADLLHQSEAIGTPLWSHVPRVVTCFDLIPVRLWEQYLHSRVRREARRLIEWRRYGRAARVLACSQKTCDELVSLLHLKRERIDLVPLGIDLGRWSAVAAEDDAPRRAALGVGGRPYVVYAGYCDHRKGVDSMFEAVARASRTAEVDLLWVGKLLDSDLEPLRARARSAGMLDRLRLLGYVTDADLAALYRGAAAHLFLSRLEGFGLSVAEALACGCPVILVRGAGADEVAAETGWLVEPDDADAAARGIEAFVHDEPLRRARVEAGLVRVQRFERRIMARAYVTSWLRVLASLR